MENILNEVVKNVLVGFCFLFFVVAIPILFGIFSFVYNYDDYLRKNGEFRHPSILEIWSKGIKIIFMVITAFGLCGLIGFVIHKLIGLF